MSKAEVAEVAHAFERMEARTRESIAGAPDAEVKEIMEKQSAMVCAWHAEILRKLA